MPTKRSPSPSTSNITKKLKLNNHLDFNSYTNFQSKYYPKQVSIKHANQWNNGEKSKPIDYFNKIYSKGPPKLNQDEKFLVHLFKNDLRIHDNTSFYNCIKDSQKINANPIGIYIISTKFWNSHLESSYKIDFILRNLKSLKESLLKLNIPLFIYYFDDDNKSNNEFVKYLESIMTNLKSNTIYYNLNYEIDEFNRDLLILENSKLESHIYHDQCIVPPQVLTTLKGTQFSKFSPFYKKWDEYLKTNPIELLELDFTKDKFSKWDWSQISHDNTLEQNDLTYNHFKLNSLKDLGVSDKDIKQTQDFYKSGESEAQTHLTNWFKKIKNYQSNKDFPSEISTSRLSPYITQGVISPRYIVLESMKLNKGKRVGGNTGIDTFIKEVGWRDFYRHVMINWPFLMMFIPFNFSSLDLKWSQDYENFEKWCLGETGFPIVDASMKQLLNTGYMNNRCRMIVASFLTKDLAIDWRIGERWFYNHLIDGDLISNNGGWGFASSTGLDAQPWFRIFNVYTQSEKFDSKGEFIKKWLPNLSKLDNVHEPYNEKIDHKEVEKLTNGYPKPIVDRKKAREETLNRYRDALM
ncbi:Deoxyribodipyrimidine photo-lyase [Wickerhamomyces ciferrii]|uniref:Deoxyribodipyrimidine photo-lyase n=1 Tax=Wickerhamomyces ciferrii (strain ATCC 14091 / BCRC 22168 / CBS 111 / JCM 3599 / NBRC 0793 / NRRL Y-1031 F-60-10) TaxID=1206466 RepID=K0KNQ4_WICCF|nr:Deoxyribodipyrimidine photo-lyase [Wickerhamomyces ciferrii]CCH44621.1 Deoxyribodipyrimidine photo-lyase [Wickerhamomyces ciferrii]